VDTDISVRQEGPIETGRTTTRRNGPLLWAVAVFASGVLALLVVAVLRPAKDNPLQLINRTAPDFTMSLYGGGTLHLAALRGKTVVLMATSARQPETFFITPHGLIQRKYAMPFTDERTLARLIEETRA
jgi:hypothetical protein